MFSFGIVLMEMLGVMQSITAGPSVKRLPPLPSECKKKFPFIVEKIKMCTKKNPNERPTVTELLLALKGTDQVQEQ